MSDPSRPQGTIQVAGQVASDVVTGLKQQPAMLSLVILNLVGIGAALYFFSTLANLSRERMDMILKACLPKEEGSLLLHDQGNDSGGNNGDKDFGVRLKVN
jgi:hypothetical protein